MSVIRLSAQVTAASPALGELVGLDVVDVESGRHVVDHAVFRPMRPVSSLDPMLAPGISLEDAMHRMPFDCYRQSIERILMHADRIEGPHLERDWAFLEAQGVKPPVKTNVKQRQTPVAV